MTAELDTGTRWDLVGAARLRGVGAVGGDDHELSGRIAKLMAMSVRGLAGMYRPRDGTFPHTMRGSRSSAGPYLRREGESLRYASVVALGLGRVPVADQRWVLAGATAAQLAETVAQRAVGSHDPGAVALAAWAAAEVAGYRSRDLFASLSRWPLAGVPVPTVSCAWALSAALSAGSVDLARDLGERLLDSQSAVGLFPHLLGPGGAGVRGGVACYADQTYPIQALARLHAVTGSTEAIVAANHCATTICAMQGPEGQWWWHYDHRLATVLEPYPVYSVHQHAMGPMALLELGEAGGDDHRSSVARGLRWIETHPEVINEMIADHLDVVWRKVGRRGPDRTLRVLAAMANSARPGARIPGVDVIFPPVQIDYECRPYELGWLLYAWAGSQILVEVKGASSHESGR